MTEKYIYYDAVNDYLFLTDLQHHMAHGILFYPAHNIFFIGEL